MTLTLTADLVLLEAADLVELMLREDSFFASCERDELGHCTSGGGAGESPADHLPGVAGTDPVTPEHEAKLDEAADKKAGGILSAIASLPGKVVPQRVKDAVGRVKDAVIGAMRRRYGEKATGLILKAAAISAPIPVPGSQPITIAVALLVAEAVRAFKGPPTAPTVKEGLEVGQMTHGELAAAARELLADLERRLADELGDLAEGCVPNRKGGRYHDDKTGYPCSPTGGAPGAGPDPTPETPGKPRPAKHPQPKPPGKGKALKAAHRYQDPARRRRVIRAVKNEGELATAIGGVNLPDSEPADVVLAVDAAGKRLETPEQIRDFLRHRETAVQIVERKGPYGPGGVVGEPSEEMVQAAEAQLALPLHFFEVKTLLTSSEGAVHINAPALARKERWMRRYGAPFHIVAVDDRRGGKHSGNRVHVSPYETAKTFRLEHMRKADDMGAVLEHL